MKKSFVLNPEVVYREVNGELVLIQLRQGEFFHLNAEARGFLELFKSPRRLEDFLPNVSFVNSENGEGPEKFCEVLIAEQILCPTADEATRLEPNAKFEVPRPRLIRKADKKLGDLDTAFLSS